MHLVDQMRDSAHAFPFFTNYIRDTYEWWAPGNREFLLRIETLKVLPFMVGLDTTYVTTVGYTNQFPVSVEEKMAADVAVKIYPVPARGELTIDIADAEDNGSTYLFDMMGKEVTRVNCAKGKQQYKINTLTIPSGIYMLRINTSNRIVTRKVEIL